MARPQLGARPHSCGLATLHKYSVSKTAGKRERVLAALLSMRILIVLRLLRAELYICRNLCHRSWWHDRLCVGAA